MAEVTVKQRVVDPSTGSISMQRKTFEIDPRDPYNSLVFHRTADALGVNAFERTDPHISKQVATIYNFISNQVDSTNQRSIDKAIENYKKNTGVAFEGRELAKHIYKSIKFAVDRKQELTRVSMFDESRKDAERTIKEGSSKAKKLRKDAAKTMKEHAESVRKTEVKTQESVERHKKELPKDSNIKMGKPRDIPAPEQVG